MTVVESSFKPVIARTQSLADLLFAFKIPYQLMGQADPSEVNINHVAPLAVAGEGAFTFLSNPKLRPQLLSSRASVVALTQADYDDLSAQDALCGKTTYVCTSATYPLYAHVAQCLHATRALQAGIHSSAVVADSAQIHPSAQIDAHVVIGARAQIGERVHLKAGVVVGDDVVIHNDSTLHANVTIYNACEIGMRAIIHAGAVIGSDGFGFAPSAAGWQKIPQVGRVLIGNDVEIGANTTIDRGALNDTVIHDDVKLDNQIQIAHNCVIGAHTAIASCVGIAGSTTIGSRCMIGGAAMIGGHLSIADNTVISGATAVPSSITQSGQYSGIMPPMLHRDWERNASLIRHLSELRKRVRTLEKNNPNKEA